MHGKAKQRFSSLLPFGCPHPWKCNNANVLIINIDKYYQIKFHSEDVIRNIPEANN